jgi:hypothetical protein
MATALEQAWIMAVGAAAGVRQAAYQAATATYVAAGFTPAARATLITAMVAADVAFDVACNTASTTAGITPFVAEGQPWGGFTSTVIT